MSCFKTFWGYFLLFGYFRHFLAIFEEWHLVTLDLDMFSALLWQKLKNNVWPLGKIQAMLGATKEQRREYKAKFVDMDVEFARMRERLETMNLILDDIQVRINVV